MAGNSPPWSFLKANEMEAINEGVWMYGDRSWRKVAEHVKKTTGATRSISILTRAWFLGLCPKTRKAPLWDKEKTEKLKNLIKIHGKDPVFLSLKFFPEYPPKFLSYIISSLGSKQENRDPRTRHIGNYGTPNISRRE
ncbi:hypothetical protein IW140_004757 [Coemansia sp. RSA 1813]|nr:hypothetical protein EV178_004785 [Coemansia sp. RSA 1646]KAJ1768987.1 hypothetical protein LPJ74_004417 [Coemansia sp. RSA 1843]KAJ2087581.1 hypothetical protein IW138_004864 [Coemansia sp. RSA 986]KAJ2212537.1 hypothetical protein EV179_004589 [Coemansia sp. RSA 487]KAJ2566894.1 hypothetical protein IW140_004757 [Coemansia sp. RSA 1813]